MPTTDQPTLQPLTVTAHLAQGVAIGHPWGIALDGLLASQLWQTLLCTTDPDRVPWPSRTDTPPDLDLPLARCTTDPEHWHWAATTAYPGPGAPTEVRHRTSRPHSPDLEHAAAALPMNLPSTKGRYRTRRSLLFVTITSTLTWQAIGDVDQIRQLLEPITSIGKNRTAGDGHVLQWTITPAPHLTHHAAAHLHPDTSLGRPVPPTCAPDHPRDHTGTAGLRPPYNHPARQAHLALPTADLDRPTTDDVATVTSSDDHR